MSNFFSRAIHPETGEVEQVEYLDDYYGRHRYGVRFSDGMVFPESDVESVEQLEDECGG